MGTHVDGASVLLIPLLDYDLQLLLLSADPFCFGYDALVSHLFTIIPA